MYRLLHGAPARAVDDLGDTAVDALGPPGRIRTVDARARIRAGAPRRKGPRARRLRALPAHRVAAALQHPAAPLARRVLRGRRVAALGVLALHAFRVVVDELTVLVDLHRDVVLGALRLSPRPPAFVLSLEHLVDVVELELRLDFGRAGGLPVQHLCSRDRVVLPDRSEDQEEDEEEPQEERSIHGSHSTYD